MAIIISGPDHNGAFKAVQGLLGQVDSLKLGEAALRYILELQLQGCLDSAQVRVLQDELCATWASAGDPDYRHWFARHRWVLHRTARRVPAGLRYSIEQALEAARYVAQLFVAIRPDIILAAHGTTQDGRWFVRLDEGWAPVDALLEEWAYCGAKSVWILSCNPDGIRPQAPAGLWVYWRIGTSNTLAGEPACWLMEDGQPAPWNDKLRPDE